ncbi:MAG: alpha/beta hydrolase [Acidobacteriota bacterium]
MNDDSPLPPASAPSSNATEPIETDNPGSQRVLRFTLPPIALAGALGAFEIARSRFQNSNMFAPSRYPAGCWDPAEEHGLRVEDIYFDSEDGTRLHGWWIPHRNPRTTLVYCHGNSGSIAERVEIFSHLQRRLRVDLFAFDYRGYGRSDGTPSEKGLFADVRAALDWVVAERGVATGDLLLFGHSLGGAVAIDGALHRPVAGLVVQSSFTQVRDMARHRFPDLPVHLIARNAFRSVEKVQHLKMPKMFIHGTADSTVPFEHGRALFTTASDPKRWFEVEGASHNDLHEHRTDRYFRRLNRFRRDCLRRRAQQL